MPRQRCAGVRPLSTIAPATVYGEGALKVSTGKVTHCAGCTGGVPGSGQRLGDWLAPQTSAPVSVRLYDVRKSYDFTPLFEKS
jgi:hypothetical protein